MKTLLVLALSTGLTFFVMSDKKEATVTQDQGINIFILSVPTNDYINLGTVKVKLTMSGSPSELYNKAVKKCKSEYPQADGLIFNSIDLDKAEAIKFK